MTDAPLDRLVTLLCVLEGDRAVELSERQLRDRVIGRELDPALGPRERLLAWMARVAPSTLGAPARALNSAGTLMLVAGFFFGLLAAAAAFYYDGSGRVNVLAVAGLLVGLPLLLLVLSWLSCLAYTRARLWPLFGDLVAALAQFSPGRLTAWLAPRLSREHKAHLALLFGAGPLATDPAVPRVRTWFFARWSHLVGTGYFIGVLTGMSALVVFTDLVFGWSTTLMVTGERLHALAASAAVPWAWLWPEAVPSLALVETSQYYRAGTAITEQATLARLGQWWRFVLMLTLVYGFAPRLVSAFIASSRLDACADHAITALRESQAVLERLQPPVSGQAEHAPAAPASPLFARQPMAAPSTAPRVDGAASGMGIAQPGVDGASRGAGEETQADIVINWSGLPVSDAHLQADFGAGTVRAAGGTRSLDDDAGVIDEVAARWAAMGSARVIVVCKAWEPPLLELQDFIDDLHKATGAQVVLMPVAVQAGRAAAPAERDREIWLRSFSATHVTVRWLEAH